MRTDVRAWIKKADEDYGAARSLLRFRGFSNVIGFLAQQCVEKYLKALLTDRGTTFSKTHDLVILLDLVLQQGPDGKLRAVRKRLGMLTPLATEVRYPGRRLGRKDARQAVRDMQRVRALIRKRLGLR